MACPDARAGQAVALSQLLQRQQRALSGQLLPMLQQGRPTAYTGAALEVFQLAEAEGPSHGPGALLSLPPKLLQSAAAVASGRSWGGLAATTNSNHNSNSMQRAAVTSTSSSSSSNGPCSNPQWVLALAGPEPSSSSNSTQGWPGSSQGERFPPWQQQQQQPGMLPKTGSALYSSPSSSVGQQQQQQQQQQEAGAWQSSSSSSGPTPPFASAALTAGTSSSSAAAGGGAGHPCARFLNSDMGRVLGFAAAQLLAHLGGLVAAAGQHHQQGWPLNQNPQQRQQQQQREGGVQQQQQQQGPWRGMRMPWQRGDNAGEAAALGVGGRTAAAVLPAAAIPPGRKRVLISGLQHSCSVLLPAAVASSQVHSSCQHCCVCIVPAHVLGYQYHSPFVMFNGVTPPITLPPTLSPLFPPLPVTSSSLPLFPLRRQQPQPSSRPPPAHRRRSSRRLGGQGGGR
jgi:hypothetical protein